jgi:glycosyltransferase involved in cell wall biosynthesis
MMRIAYVLPFLSKPSGWRNHTLAFLKAISRYVEPLIWVAENENSIAAELLPDFPLHTLPVTQMASLSSFSGARGLLGSRWAITRAKYPAVELVHSLEAYPTGLVGTWLAQKMNRPHLITIHGTYGVVWHQSRIDRPVYSRVLQQANLLCPVSQGTADLMQAYFGRSIDPARLRPILNGNDFVSKISRQDVFNRQPADPPSLLSVGDIKPRKGQLVSLQAFAELKDKFPQLRYRIVGDFSPDNSYYKQMENFIAEHELTNVEVVGTVTGSRLQEFFRQASVFVLTPQQDGLNFEGFGLVYLEAGAFGLPVVATRIGGVADAVLNGKTGFLLEPKAVDEISLAIAHLLSDPDLAQRMGQANREWAETLTWERNASLYFQAYQKVMGQ